MIWANAGGQDVPDIVALAQHHFESEIDTIFTPEPVIYARNITMAVVRQFYGPNEEFVRVARDHNHELAAYVWAGRGERAPWSDNEMIVVRMAHVDLSQPARTRVRLVNEMIDQWEAWAVQCGVPVVCSSTVRRDQDGFLKLHQRRGYDIRGSYAYKRMDLR